MQKDPFRRPDADDLLEIVPDFIEFITESNWIEDSNEFESNNTNLLNRYDVARTIVISQSFSIKYPLNICIDCQTDLWFINFRLPRICNQSRCRSECKSFSWRWARHISSLLRTVNFKLYVLFIILLVYSSCVLRLLDFYLGRRQTRTVGTRRRNTVEKRSAMRRFVIGQTYYAVIKTDFEK